MMNPEITQEIQIEAARRGNRWREWITLWLSLLAFSGTVAFGVFQTKLGAKQQDAAVRADMRDALILKADKDDCDKHEGAPAHREQMIVNRHTIASVQSIEALVKEIAVETGSLTRRQVMRLAPNRKPLKKP